MDKVTKEMRSKIMSSIKRENTKPELALRKALWARGIRYRAHYGDEHIDIAFPTKKLAIFVDGCFWHGCPKHLRLPKSNESYWHPKLRKNIERDRAKEARLKADGWAVVRIWEHELSDVNGAVRKIKKALIQAPPAPPSASQMI